jgi:hypothetical protein
MEYNLEERKFIKRIWFQLSGFLIVFLAIAAYQIFIYDGKSEIRTYVPLIGAMFSAFLTQYSVFTVTIFTRAMKKYQNFEFHKHKLYLIV